MKIVRKHSKQIALILSFTFLIQSCSVYQTKTVSVDEAVQSFKKVKINSTRNDIYKFKKLSKEDGKLYGIAKKKSRTAKNLSFQDSKEIDHGKYLKILVPENIIKEIHLQNKTMSVVLPIIISLAVVIGLLAIFQVGNVGSGYTIPLYM